MRDDIYYICVYIIVAAGIVLTVCRIVEYLI